MKTAILFSGGIDSTSLLFWKRPRLAMTIDYGQRAAAGEIRSASRICSELKIPHDVLKIDCSLIALGTMARTEAVDARAQFKLPTPEWWPFRNQLLVTLAAAKLVPLRYKKLLLGTVQSDRQHKDGTTQFVKALSRLTSLQEGGLIIEAPAIALTSLQLVRRSGIPLPVLGWTHSCHHSSFACGLCRGCHKNMNIWRELES